MSPSNRHMVPIWVVTATSPPGSLDPSTPLLGGSWRATEKARSNAHGVLSNPAISGEGRSHRSIARGFEMLRDLMKGLSQPGLQFVDVEMGADDSRRTGSEGPGLDNESVHVSIIPEVMLTTRGLGPVLSGRGTRDSIPSVPTEAFRPYPHRLCVWHR